MGRSTVAQLIAKGKAENAYNNSGIKTDNQWFDFFNDALSDLVDDINLQETLIPISLVPITREYDLPSDFFSMFVLYESQGLGTNRIQMRRSFDQMNPPGYWIRNSGDKYVIDLYNYSSPITVHGLYIRYPAVITADDQFPEVQSVGERALIYYAIWKGCMNSNESTLGISYKNMYEEERKKIRNAAARGGM